MKLSFSKYHGAGNDFIVIDNRKGVFIPEQNLIKNLCHRQFGIGADGLMLLENEANADFRMRYFNSDGNEGTMCGNGGRCITHFANKLGVIGKQTRFVGIDGEHEAIIDPDSTVNLRMNDVQNVLVDDEYCLLDTGSPHCVCFVKNIDKVDVESEGRILRNSLQPELGGVNVNFVEFVGDKLIIRTYERGVEAETLACGTGSVAAAIAANVRKNSNQTSYLLEAKGGALRVKFEKIENNTFRNIWLQGPATHVFDGEIKLV